MRVLSDEFKASIDRWIESSTDEHLIRKLPCGEKLYSLLPNHEKVVYTVNKLKAEVDKRGIGEHLTNGFRNL